VRTIIALTPGAKRSSLAVVRASGPRDPGYVETIELATAATDPVSLSEMLLLVKERWPDTPPTLVVEDTANDIPPDTDVLKVQGFCEGIGRVLGFELQRVGHPAHNAVWNDAWWQLSRLPQEGPRSVPDPKLIAALANALANARSR
jgi:hypothetical protein